MDVTTNINNNNNNICIVTTTNQVSTQPTTTTTGDLPQYKYHCPFARTDSTMQLQPTPGLPAACMTSLVRRASVCTETGVDRMRQGLSRDPFKGSLSCLATIGLQRGQSIIESLDKKYRENISNRIRNLKPHNLVSSSEQLPVIARKPPESGILPRLNVYRSANYQNVLAAGSAVGPGRRGKQELSTNNDFLPAPRHSTLPARLDCSQYAEYLDTCCPVEMVSATQQTSSSCDSLNSSTTDDSSGSCDDISNNSFTYQQQQQHQQLNAAANQCNTSIVDDDSCYLAPPPAIPSSASPLSTPALPSCFPSLTPLSEPLPGMGNADLQCPATNNNLSAVNSYLPTTQDSVTSDSQTSSYQRSIESNPVTPSRPNDSSTGRVYRTAIKLSISPSHTTTTTTTTTRRDLNAAPVKHVSTFLLSPVSHISSPSDVITPDDDIPPPLPSLPKPVFRRQTPIVETFSDVERTLEHKAQSRTITAVVRGRPASAGAGSASASTRPSIIVAGSCGAGSNKLQTNIRCASESQLQPTIISDESFPSLNTTPTYNDNNNTTKHVTNGVTEMMSQTVKQQTLNMDTYHHSSATSAVCLSVGEGLPVPVPVRVVVHGQPFDKASMNGTDKLQQQQQRTSATPQSENSCWSTVTSSEQFIYAPTTNKQEQHMTTLVTSDMTSLSRVIVVPIKKEHEADIKVVRNVAGGQSVERSWETYHSDRHNTVRPAQTSLHSDVVNIPVQHESVKAVKQQQQQHCHNGELLQVDINKSCLGLTFSIEGGKDSLDGDRPITVKRVFRPGEVLQVGDQIISVNGKQLSMTSHYAAWNYLKSLPEGPLHLVIRRQRT